MPDAPLPDPHPTGSFVGRYQIVRCIGRGGMGSVYEARHLELGKRVALKVLRADVAAQPGVRARFVREGQAASRIRHAHVADVTDVGVHEAVPYLVMEYLEGEDLAAMVTREGPLPAQRAVDLLLPVLAAVHTAHEESVVHRDLKPANIFLARDRYGEVSPKVLDFGVSKITDGDESQGLTGAEALLGTPYYMAPEQVMSARNTTPASDQFSLGVVLYACLTRQLPYSGPNAFTTMQSIVQGQFVPPRQLVPAIPEGVEAVVLRAMSASPAQRFPSLREMGAALLPYANPETLPRWRPVFGVEVSSRPVTLPPPSRPAAQALAVPTPVQPPLGAVSTLTTLSTTSPPTEPRPRPVGRWLGASLLVASVMAIAAYAGVALRRHTLDADVPPRAGASVAPSVAPPRVVAPSVVARPVAPSVAVLPLVPSVAVRPVAPSVAVLPLVPSVVAPSVAPSIIARPVAPSVVSHRRTPRTTPAVEQTANGGTIIR